jgi:hypothetical protein
MVQDNCATFYSTGYSQWFYSPLNVRMQVCVGGLWLHGIFVGSA